MADEFDEHAGKPPEDRHPPQLGTETDPSDYADPRVARPGEDPDGERAMRKIGEEEPQR